MTTFDVMVDIDDVIFPWADTIHERARAMGLHNIESYSSWHMWEDYGVTKDAWLDVVSKAAWDGMYLDATPMPGSLAPLRHLAFEGHRIHLVTARGGALANDNSHDQIEEWTREWVAEHAVPHETLTFTKDKVAAQETLGVGFDYAIDDGIHNIKALQANDVKAYLLVRPHNLHLCVDQRFVVDSVAEFVEIIEAASINPQEES